MRQFNLTPRARRQLRAAITWWYRNRDKAPSALVEEFDETVAVIVETPGVGKPVPARRPGVRRVLSERVRYYVYYRVNASGDIFPGKVVNGRATDEEDDLTLEERAKPDAELEAAIEEADRGDVVPAEEVLRGLRAKAEEEIRRGRER